MDASQRAYKNKASICNEMVRGLNIFHILFLITKFLQKHHPLNITAIFFFFEKEEKQYA